MVSRDNLMIMGDFNCKKVRWEEWSMDRSSESWGVELLRMAMGGRKYEVQGRR